MRQTVIRPLLPEDIEDDIRLTYIAITRATHEAFITYSHMSELVSMCSRRYTRARPIRYADAPTGTPIQYLASEL